jgi:hypothetical protein
LATATSKVWLKSILYFRVLTSSAGLEGGNVSATVKHFTAFGSPEQGLRLQSTVGKESFALRTFLHTKGRS